MNDRNTKSDTTTRGRRVIVLFEDELFSLLKATALLCGYQNADEYARAAILERFDSDRQKIQSLMEKNRKKS